MWCVRLLVDEFELQLGFLLNNCKHLGSSFLFILILKAQGTGRLSAENCRQRTIYVREVSLNVLYICCTKLY